MLVFDLPFSLEDGSNISSELSGNFQQTTWRYIADVTVLPEDLECVHTSRNMHVDVRTV